MNLSNSERSSGCESGWTTYLDEISNSTDKYTRVFAKNSNVDQEDDDLSMVSDASSGPRPHFQEYENYAEASTYENKKKSKQSKSKTTTRAKKTESFCLDDTATSPLPHFAQDDEAPSGYYQEFSAARVEGESTAKKHLGFFKSSTKGKSSSLLGRKKQ